MVLVPVRRLLVGTSDAERKELARQFDCHPTWLNDDLPQHEAVVPAFWIDRFPVTNAQYLAFVEATSRAAHRGGTDGAARFPANMPTIPPSDSAARMPSHTPRGPENVCPVPKSGKLRWPVPSTRCSHGAMNGPAH